MPKKSIEEQREAIARRVALKRQAAELERLERLEAEDAQRFQDEVTSENRSRTIADVEEYRGSLQSWRTKIGKELAANDAKSREANMQSGRQTDRSVHLLLGPAGAAPESRAGAGRRAKEEREEQLKNGTLQGRPPWA